MTDILENCVIKQLQYPLADTLTLSVEHVFILEDIGPYLELSTREAQLETEVYSSYCAWRSHHAIIVPACAAASAMSRDGLKMRRGVAKADKKLVHYCHCNLYYYSVWKPNQKD